MKLKQEQLDRLADLLLAGYKAKELVTIKTTEVEIKGKMMSIVRQNFAEEEAIEEEARKVLAAYAQAPKEVDPYRMFLLAKQKIAARKGFIL
jgi:hypothetical protein